MNVSRPLYPFFIHGIKLSVYSIPRLLNYTDGLKTVPHKVTSGVKYYTTKAEHESGQHETGVGQQRDIYGPPHSISNIPHIKFAVADNETVKEKKYREFKEDLATWHQQFWLKHNENFNKSKKAYLNKMVNPNTIIDEKQHADDLSIFYKYFLDKNLRTHMNYQREWYKKVFKALWYGLQVDIERLSKTFQIKNSNNSNKFEK